MKSTDGFEVKSQSNDFPVHSHWPLKPLNKKGRSFKRHFQATENAVLKNVESGRRGSSALDQQLKSRASDHCGQLNPTEVEECLSVGSVSGHR